MKTYPISSEKGQCCAFEIENAYIRPRTIATLLAGLSVITDVRLRRPFSASSDIHLRFRYQDHEFVVWEPYGDNSRYWIGPADEKDISLDTTELRTIFDSYAPPLPVKILGDVITLNFRSLFRLDARRAEKSDARKRDIDR